MELEPEATAAMSCEINEAPSAACCTAIVLPCVTALCSSTAAAMVDWGTIGSVFFQGDHALAQVLVGDQHFLVAIREGSLPERGAEVALTWNDGAVIPLTTE